MPETLSVDANASKAERYEQLLPQLKSLVDGEYNLVANMANVSAALKEVFNFWWVGFYLIDKEKEDELVLGPFQGPIACTRIKYGRGVCGSSWKQNKVIIVPDVDKFPGHIACSSLSKSEIVVPLQRESKIIGVLDVDSEHYENFDETDKKYLVNICEMIGR